MTPVVVSLGEGMLRLAPPRGERLDRTRHLDVVVAGAEANVAVALASLGVGSRWVSALPANPLGRRVARELSSAGVDVSSVEWVDDGRLGLFFIEFGSAPRPTTVWYDRADSAFSRMTGFKESALAGVSYAVTSGITLALSDESHRLAERFLADARERGARTCIDVNYRERLWSASDARDALAPILARTDLVVCSRRDAARVFDIAGDSVADVAREMRDRVATSAELLVITDGASGATGVAGAEVFEVPGLEADVVDRIGAGDGFLAGLLWGMLEGADPRSAIGLGCALGALACTVHGDHAVFEPSEVRAAVNERRVLIR